MAWKSFWWIFVTVELPLPPQMANWTVVRAWSQLIIETSNLSERLGSGLKLLHGVISKLWQQWSTEFCPRWLLHCVTYICCFTHTCAGPWAKSACKVWSFCTKSSLSAGNGWVTPGTKSKMATTLYDLQMSFHPCMCWIMRQVYLVSLK